MITLQQQTWNKKYFTIVILGKRWMVKLFCFWNLRKQYLPNLLKINMEIFWNSFILMNTNLIISNKFVKWYNKIKSEESRCINTPFPIPLCKFFWQIKDTQPCLGQTQCLIKIFNINNTAWEFTIVQSLTQAMIFVGYYLYIISNTYLYLSSHLTEY